MFSFVSRPRAVAVLAAALLLPAWAPEPIPAVGAVGWSWPLSPRPAVVGHWAPPAERWSRGHRGVDLGTAPGAPVRAPAAGTVSFAGVVVDRPVLTVDHGGGVRSSFEPVETALAPGEQVRRGQVLGVVRGRDHCREGLCLHWGVRRGDDYVNPLGFLGVLEPSILLPVPAELRTPAQLWSF